MSAERLRVTVDGRRLKHMGVGIAVYLDTAVKALIEGGASVTLLTDEESHATTLAETYGTAVDTIAQQRTFRWEQRDLRRYLKAHAPDVHLCGANYGIPAFFRGRTKLALIVHDLLPLLMPRVYLAGRPTWALRYLLSVGAAATSADVVITSSHANAQLVRRIMRARNVETLYPLLPKDSDVGGQEPIPGLPARYFLYNGGYDPRKNVRQMLAAVELLQDDHPGVGLVCTGNPPPEMTDLMDSKGELVRRTGFVSEEQKSALIDGAEGLVYPSRYEGFGLPIIEAFLRGVPVVTGTGGALREVAGNAAIFIDPDEPTSIAHGLSRALDPLTRTELLAAAAHQLDALRGHPSISSITSVLMGPPVG